MDQLLNWRPQSQEIELATLPKVLVRHPLVVVHAWAVWNRHDRRMDEILQGLMPRYAGRVELRSLDADSVVGHDFWRDCRIFNLPALAAFVRGIRVETVIGLRQRGELDVRLRDWIKAAETQHSMWDPDVDGPNRGGRP
jgi:thioredoxin-like negative regulator of GroEL